MRVEHRQVRDTHRGHHAHGLRDGGALVVVHPLALVGDVEGTRPIRILGCDADRAVVGVAPLRLDATRRHHHRPGRVGVVGALNQALDDVVSGRDLAARPDPYPVPQTRSHQRVVHDHQPVGERKSNVVLVFQWRRGGSALGAVHNDEVGRHAFGQHRLAGRQHIDPGTDTQLEAHRFTAGQFAQSRHEQHQFARGAKSRVRGRTDALHTNRHSSVTGDLLGDLGSRQHAANAGLRTLAQLDRDALHQIVSCFGREHIRIERTVLGAGTEIA